MTEAMRKLRKYCAYQDRCHQEVQIRLKDWGFGYDETGEVISLLIEEGFLNEERFARSYVRGKFRQKGWGRIRIRMGLQQKGIFRNLQQIAFDEIDDDEYITTLKKLLEKKDALLAGKDIFRRKHKLAAFAIRKGFESDLVWGEVKQMYNDQ